MSATEALKDIRTLIRVAEDSDNIQTVRKLMAEMKAIADKALKPAN